MEHELPLPDASCTAMAPNRSRSRTQPSSEAFVSRQLDEWSQTWDVTYPKRPTMSLHPAADCPSSSKYQLSSLPYFALGDDLDCQGWWHRWWRWLTQLSSCYIMQRLHEDPLPSILVPPSILPPHLMRCSIFVVSRLLSSFEHSKATLLHSGKPFTQLGFWRVLKLWHWTIWRRLQPTLEHHLCLDWSKIWTCYRLIPSPNI